MKIVFFGTPDFAVTVLKKIYESGHEISAVVTAPDK
ncbi:MAG: methionyl-tRNA formyltransferase, partial [Melioribacteraceae bacterium]